jgi:hypothetical protein
MCALKVSLSTAKVKRMPAPDRLPPAERGIRLLRLVAGLSVLTAMIAVVTIVRGDAAGKSHILIVAAIVLGAGALLGMAIVTLSHAYRRKDQNEPRP